MREDSPLEKSRTKIAELESELALLRWIPVSERLPEAMDDETEYSLRVLCASFPVRHFQIDQYLVMHERWSSRFKNYTHWMPIPPLSEQEAKSDE